MSCTEDTWAKLCFVLLLDTLIPRVQGPHLVLGIRHIGRVILLRSEQQTNSSPIPSRAGLLQEMRCGLDQSVGQPVALLNMCTWEFQGESPSVRKD